MNTSKMDLNDMFQDTKNSEFKRLIHDLGSSLMTFGYQLGSEVTKRILASNSIEYQIEFSQSASPSIILLRYYTRSSVVAFFIKNGHQEMDYSSYLACEYRVPIVYPKDFNGNLKSYYEEQLVRFLTHLSDSIIVDILQGKTWKQWHSSWGQERQ